jgi:glutamate transport system permease protein
MSAAIAFDQPGPRTRRRLLAVSVIASAVLIALAGLVLWRLWMQGQLSGPKWGPLVNPAHPLFVTLWTKLGLALRRNGEAALLAMTLSLLIGTVLAVARISLPRWARWSVATTIEFFRGLPVVIAIFFAARVMPELGISLPLLWYLVIGLTAYNSVIIAEIVRAGLASLPCGQAEAAAALGLTRGQALRVVLLPQAFRVMLPTLISQLVVIFKDTSLGFVILYAEAVRFVAIAIQELHNPLQLYFTIGIIFILINYLLSTLAVFVQQRTQLRRPSRLPAVPGAAPHGAVFAGSNAAGG